MTAPPPASVMVYVGLDRVGDGLLKLPFVRGLRHAFPAATITWVAGKETSVYASTLAPVVSGLLDEVIEKCGKAGGLPRIRHHAPGGAEGNDDPAVVERRTVNQTATPGGVPSRTFLRRILRPQGRIRKSGSERVSRKTIIASFCSPVIRGSLPTRRGSRVGELRSPPS